MAVKTRAQLKSENTTDFPDNTTRLISAADLRGQMDDTADSALFFEDITNGLNVSPANVTATASAGGVTKTLAAWAADIVAAGGPSPGADEFDTVADMLADNHAALGVGTVWRGDGFRYREADPAATDHHLTTAGGVKLYVQPGDDGWYNFLAMNPARDGVTNDAPKLQKLLDIRPFGGGLSPSHPHYVTGPSIQIPEGIYYMDSGPWGFQIKAVTHLRGEGHAPDNDFRNTSLVFPPDVVGFMVNYEDTYQDTIETTPSGGALGTTIERMNVRVKDSGVAIGSNPNAHGIWARTTVHIRDVTVYGFYGHGIAITGSSGPQPNPLDHGGPSSFSLTNVTSFKNHNCGIFVQGHDASIGVCQRIDVNNNGRWGVYDDSFAGDVWIMVHSEVNGLAGRGGNPLGSSSMVYVAEGDGTNSIYYAKHTATPTQLVTVPPGTNEAVWVTYLPHYAGSVGTNYALWTAGKPVGTYFAGGSFWNANTAGRSMFIGCYAEGDAPGTVGNVSLALGGVALWQGGAVYKASNGIMTTESGYGVIDKSSNKITIAGDPSNSATLFRALNYQSAAEALPWLWEYISSTGDWSLDYGNTTNRAYNLTSINTTQKMGTSKTQPYLMHFPTLAIGGSTTARRQTTNSAKPATGEWAAGDVIWNTAATPTKTAGWLVTKAGAFGSTTWATGTNYALNAYVLASNGKYYRCSVDPGGVLTSTVEPSHATGEVINTATDQYGWTFVSLTLPEILPFGEAVDIYDHTSTGTGLSLAVATHPRQIIFSATVSTTFTIGVTATGAYPGAKFHITRTDNGVGTVNVGTGPLKALPARSWCHITYDGTAWYLSAYGTL